MFQIGLLKLKNILWFCCFVCCLSFFHACKSDAPVVPDVSDIEVSLDIQRFEQDFFQLDSNNLAVSLTQLEEKYPDFYPLYFNSLLPVKGRGLDSLLQLEFIKGFLSFAPTQEIYGLVQTQYENLDPQKESIEKALALFKYYFPSTELPTSLTTFLADFSYGAILYGDNQLAIGLDLFLDDYNYANVDPQDPAFSSYLTRTYNSDHLAAKLIQNLIDDKVGPPKGNRMIDFMINNGKKLYLLDKMFPYTSDTVKMEVTPEQWSFLEENDRDMWTFFLSEELIYNTNWRDIRKYVDYSPNSPGMPEVAPGRTANYLGWQIVKAFMRRAPNYSMDDLVAEEDAQRILELSRYKPGR